MEELLTDSTGNTGNTGNKVFTRSVQLMHDKYAAPLQNVQNPAPSHGAENQDPPKPWEKHFDNTYCGSYTVLENTLYLYVDAHYSLNIYDDRSMETFFAGTCHLYSM